MRKGLVVPLLALIAFMMTAHWWGVRREIIRIRDAARTDFSTMVDDVSSARVVYIGESHDNVHHHESQLEVITSLHEKGYPLAIGLEMFKKEDQKQLDQWVEGRIDERTFRKVFRSYWGFGWELYGDIFRYARKHSIPMIGLNVPKKITKKVAKGGFGSLTKDERAQLPPAVTCDVDSRYRDHLRMIFHYKGMVDRSFVNFCEAQVLWDQAMAWYIARYLEKHQDRAVIVLAGSVHAWKFGIPRQLGRMISIEQRVILPEVPVESNVISVDDADYLLLHG
jgi:uncharacterized iron-regulated protein